MGHQQDVITRISHLTEDSMMSATGISSSSSEHDNQETNAWSSDYSNSEDEFTHGEDGVLPVGDCQGSGQGRGFAWGTDNCGFWSFLGS